MYRIALIFILTIYSLLLAGQTVNYEVIRGEKKLGDMTVKRSMQQEEVFYEIKSKVVFKLLFSFTIDYESTSEYKRDRLIKEYTHNQLNGNTQKKSTIWWDGKVYTLDLDGSRINFSNKIEYSVASIYFEEPTDGQQVFSPQFGKYLSFVKIGPHKYEMQSPDGLNVYSYTNGICTEVKVNRDFARFSFVMTPESLVAVQKKIITGGGANVD
ncbi:MAG: DUF6134 family protein [Bacteroidota bacterium]